MTTANLHTLTGAYALHALPDGEREEFERHLAGCASCAQEVRELSATAERLGLAASLVPPPQMKERVLWHVATVRQEPPYVPGQLRSGRARRRGRSLSRFALAACLAGAAALGGVAVWQHQAAEQARQEARQAQRQTEELARVLAAADAQASSGKLAGGGTGTVVVSRSRDKAAFLADGMPTLPDDKVYQLWFSDGGTMRPAGLMPSPAGTAAVLMDGPVGDASAMGVTVEPAGGSEQPTTDPLAVVEFRAPGAAAPAQGA
ncbi:anti-sigma factor [Streptomyces sp. KR80]|uniref:anti-sigma factor n=1 Tax=Streptomyces sp. KR80 TaxID=3457426 RepID=UPI003FD3E247